MPPACRFTREQIVAAALAITRERGFDAVTARAIADTLHSSSKVIFSAFSGMDDLLAATIDAADAQYRAYSADFVRDSADPPYKAVGTAYIRFARNEPNLFHLLYMRDRRREDHSGDAENIAVLVDFLMAKLHITREDATLLHIEMWAYVHGIAVLAILGNARHYLHQERAVSRFFTQRSYALYVVHYPVLLLTASLLTERTTLPAAATYLLTLVICFGATLGLSEVICRIPGIRYLTLGIRKEKKA